MYGSCLGAGCQKSFECQPEMPQNTQKKKMQKSLPMPNAHIDIYLLFMSLGIHEKFYRILRKKNYFIHLCSQQLFFVLGLDRFRVWSKMKRTCHWFLMFVLTAKSFLMKIIYIWLVAWTQLWNFMVCQVRFNSFLHPYEYS